MRSLRNIVRVCLAIGLAASLASAQETQETKEVDITGHYTSEAMKDGETFMVTRNGEVYQVLWHLAAGDWVGVAIREDDRFSIAWQRSDGANLGVSVYKIEKGETGPTLTGGWAAFQDKKISKDSLKWSKTLAPARNGANVAGLIPN